MFTKALYKKIIPLKFIGYISGIKIIIFNNSSSAIGLIKFKFKLYIRV